MRRTGRIIRQQFIGVIALCLVAGGFTYAATGQGVLLGRANTANRPTTVQNTGNGAVLDLRAKTGQPPLKVNSATLVPKLNADLLDGKHASSFALARAAYSKAQSDARYARAGLWYTKTQSDAKYAPAGSSYTKAQSDAKYAAAGASYTKAEVDARYGRVLLHQPWQGTSPDGSETQVYANQVTAPAAGTLMFVVTQSATPGSTPSDATSFYLAGEFRASALGGSPVTDDTRVFSTVVTASEMVSFQLKASSTSPPAQVDVEGTILVVFYPFTP